VRVAVAHLVIPVGGDEIGERVALLVGYPALDETGFSPSPSRNASSASCALSWGNMIWVIPCLQGCCLGRCRCCCSPAWTPRCTCRTTCRPGAAAPPGAHVRGSGSVLAGPAGCKPDGGGGSRCRSCRTSESRP